MPRARTTGLRRDAQLERARELALAALARRDRTEAQMKTVLTKAGFSQPIADEAVERLVRDSWLNDARLVHVRAESIRSRSPCGAGLLAARLEHEGFEPGSAREAAAAELPVAAERADALRVAQALIRGGVSDARQIATRLNRRGFDLATMSWALTRCGCCVDFLEHDA